MIALKCNHCGGDLEVNESEFIVSGNIAIQTSNTFTCKYCRTTFMRSEHFKLAIEIETVQEMNVQNVGTMTIKRAGVTINTGGGTYIGGNVSTAPGVGFVGRDSSKTIIIVQKS